MSSSDQRSGARERLLEMALLMLEESGPEALQARKLAAEIGTSTMAVYTHFGGMPELFEAIVREGFVRFAACLASVPVSDDSMVDFFAQGLAYRGFALRNSQLYRLMFGLTGTGRWRRGERDLTVEGSPAWLAEGQASFDVLVRSVERVKASGRVRPVETVSAAAQVWSMIHGYVLLEIAGVFGYEDAGLREVLGPLSVNLLVGLGDSREAAERSALAALAARGRE